MACADIIGRWIESILVVDTTDDVIVDPPLRIFTVTAGKFMGRFTGDAADFDVDCKTNGPQTTIEFTRTHPDGTTTKYSGRVVSFGSRGVGIIRGRFERNTPAILARERAILAMTNGDWETEKPT
jgi:hypothetical protein